MLRREPCVRRCQTSKEINRQDAENAKNSRSEIRGQKSEVRDQKKQEHPVLLSLISDF